jgi:hypothetical protein
MVSSAVCSARLGVLAAALVAATVATPGLVPPAAAAAGASIQVHGTLLVVPPEEPGGHTGYGVALADGDIVPVRGRLGHDVRSGATFDGRLAVPTDVAAALVARRESGSTAALRIVDHRHLSLAVVGTPSVTQAPPVDDVGTIHTQYVAALANKGTLGQSDTQLLGHVSNVGSYWQGQSNGAIAAVTVPSTVDHYDTTTGTTACGLGSGQAGVNDFFALVQEAAAQFPGLNPNAMGSNQLVLFVPAACSSGSTVGRGTVGTSFASGGLLVAEASPSIEGVYAHEAGHNYGFAHANARVSGSSLEYYGIYDVMGFAIEGVDQLTALSTPYRVFQGVTDAGEVQDVDLGNGLSPVHVTATIKPRSDTTGLRSVRVKDPDTGENLYLDYRSGTGEDQGSAYAAGGGLSTPNNGVLWYAPGVTINAARPQGGNDTLVLDGSGHTSLSSGTSWTNASHLLTVSVTSIGASGATVSVDYTPPQDFSSVGTPVIGGTVKVGGSVTLDTGTWVPAPTTTQIRWTADGQAQSGLDDKTQFTPGPALVGKQLVATVTQKRLGYKTTSVASAGATVQAGTIPTSANPSVSGTATVGFTLQAQTGTWSSVLSPITAAYQWRRGGVDIPGATGAGYQVTTDDVGSAITVTQRLSATGYQTAVIVSPATAVVPEPVIDPAPTPTVSGAPRVGSALHVSTGSWMDGTDLSYQWFVGGAPVAGATSTSYTPTVGDLGATVRVEVTGTRTDYPTVTRASTESAAVAAGVLDSSKPTIGGKPKVGKTLKAEAGSWTAGATFSYAWYANGTKIKHQPAAKLTLTKAQKGTRITVKVTGRKPGYTTASRTSAKTAKVG